jgi:hypothetical protein
LGTTLTKKKTPFTKILKADLSQAMLAVFRCRILGLRFFYQNIKKIKIYRTINCSVVSFGCETWSPTLEEEHKLRLFGEGC